jgi:hypothetical protein
MISLSEENGADQNGSHSHVLSAMLTAGIELSMKAQTGI